MVTPKGYTDKENIENYLLKEIDSSFDGQIDSWIASVERIIDNYTGRNFIADTVASARLFDGDDSEDLIVDECVEVTLVEAGNDSYGGTFTTVGATGSDRYFTYPSNATVLGVPIHKIVLSARTFSEGRQNQRITAKWGYSVDVPDDISFAATVFVAGIINESRGGGRDVQSESIGTYKVTYNDAGPNSWADFDRAKQILDQYRRIHI